MTATILVVEDDVDLLQLCCFALKRGDFEVVGCDTVDRAEELLHQADLVLLDIRLPGRSGLDLLRDNDVTVPVIVMSAHADDETAALALDLGAVAFVGKPFDPFALIDQVAAHLPSFKAVTDA